MSRSRSSPTGSSSASTPRHRAAATCARRCAGRGRACRTSCRGFLAAPVDGPALGGGREPGTGVARDARLRPLLQRLDEGILRQFLGQTDVADQPHERGDEAADSMRQTASIARFVSVTRCTPRSSRHWISSSRTRCPDRTPTSKTWRTSISPVEWRRAWPARWPLRGRRLDQNPAMSSLVSVNGPSVTVILPPEDVTRVPTGWSPRREQHALPGHLLDQPVHLRPPLVVRRVGLGRRHQEPHRRLLVLPPGHAGPPADASNRGRRNRHPRQFFQRATRRMSRSGPLPRPGGECATMGAASARRRA